MKVFQLSDDTSTGRWSFWLEDAEGNVITLRISPEIARKMCSCLESRERMGYMVGGVYMEFDLETREALIQTITRKILAADADSLYAAVANAALRAYAYGEVQP